MKKRRKDNAQTENPVFNEVHIYLVHTLVSDSQ